MIIPIPDPVRAVYSMQGITTAERDALIPVAGDIIYNITTNKHQGYDGTTWNDLY